MTTLYSNDIRTFLRTRDWPRGLLWEVVEFEEFLRLRFFRDNINALGSDEKLQVAKMVNETMWSIRKQGVPIYTEVAAGSGVETDT